MLVHWCSAVTLTSCTIEFVVMKFRSSAFATLHEVPGNETTNRPHYIQSNSKLVKTLLRISPTRPINEIASIVFGAKSGSVIALAGLTSETFF
jgi:hypothetical protein